MPAAYDLDTANFNLGIVGVDGSQDILAERTVVLTSAGGALIRVVLEHGRLGLPQGALGQNSLGQDVPSSNLPAVPAGCRPVLVSESLRNTMHPLNGNYREFANTHDADILDVLVVDSAADLSVDPTDPVPTFRAWCVALRGKYHDPHQP